MKTHFYLFLLWGLMATSPGMAQEQPSPLERYRNQEFPPTKEKNFDEGWKKRVSLEFDIVNHETLENLRTALDDKDGFIRALALRALAIREDRDSVDKIAALAVSDPDPTVRARAIEALGILKVRPDVILGAKSAKHGAVSWTAKFVEGQTESKTDFAKMAREAYAGGLKPQEIDQAKVGKPAPDFSAILLDGTPFKLSSVLGKHPIAIYFTAHDG